MNKVILQGLGGPLPGAATAKTISYSIIASILCFLTGCTKKTTEAPATENTTPPTSFYDLSAITIDGQEQSMSAYKGKYILVVNVASHCGFTPQYTDLEALYEQYKEKLVILGFPANNFLWQEPGDNASIKSFCSLTYHVTFPLFAKISVKGKDISPIYKWLTTPSLNGWNSEKPSWNFNKYLIGPEGRLLAHFGSKVVPTAPEITRYLK